MSNEKLKITQKRLRGEDGHRTFSVRIKEDLVAGIEDIALKTGRTRNEIISILLEYALNNCEVEPQDVKRQ